MMAFHRNIAERKKLSGGLKNLKKFKIATQSEVEKI
jgi:hypothetical protein